jgi:hypothetical protein
MKSAKVQVPAGLAVDGLSLGISASAGKNWTASLVGSTLELVQNAGTQALDRGQSVTVTFNATASCEADSLTLTSNGYNGDDFTTVYTVSGTQPTVTITGTCAPTGFVTGDYCTIGQGGWGSEPNGGNPGTILAANFDTLYSDLVVGSGFSMTFESASNVKDYLPAGSTAAALTGSVINPASTASGVFGGQVTALALNVDFNDAGITDGAEGSISGLTLQGTGGSLDGSDVLTILGAAETALGGGVLPAGYSYSDLNDLVTDLNEAFDNGCIPTDWAQIHLAE